MSWLPYLHNLWGIRDHMNYRDSAGNVNVQKETKNATNVQGIIRTMTNSGNGPNVQCYNFNTKGHYGRHYPKPWVRELKYFQEKILLAKKDEAGITLSDEHNDFLLADAFEVEEFEDLNATICMMARIQQ
ncbi:hypothetical protein Tco_0699718 [Tanacetum coccineum]